MKSLYILGDRIVDTETLKIDGVFLWDYPEFCDAYFSYGLDIDGTELNEDELNLLTDKYSDLLNELALKKMFE
tara:strand:+ start:2416 stop:2634 length:219 start_codon:yes stop_codon:yes gene_type:complete